MAIENKKTPQIRILIADDHPIFRDGLKRLLESEREFKVVGEACDGVDAVTLVHQLKPEILLLDLAMPRRAGLEALREMGTEPLSARVILLTAAAEKDQIVEALQLGARGVVLKDSAMQFLVKAIRGIVAGEFWVGRDKMRGLVQALQMAQAEDPAKKFGLTARELEVVTAIMEGHSNKEIAAKFSISEQTVKHHLSNIFDKVGVSTRLELALFAVNQSLPFKPLS